MQQERRTYSKSFKAQVVAECALPDTSIASVALTHNLNANLVHKWIRLHGQKSLTLQTSFIPIKSPVPVAMHQTLPSRGAYRIRKKSYAKVSLPVVAA